MKPTGMHILQNKYDVLCKISRVAVMMVLSAIMCLFAPSPLHSAYGHCELCQVQSRYAPRHHHTVILLLLLPSLLLLCMAFLLVGADGSDPHKYLCLCRRYFS